MRSSLTSFIKYSSRLSLISCSFCSICVDKPELLINMVNALVNRVLSEMQNPTDITKRNVIMFKCFNILRTIYDNKMFVPGFLTQLDGALEPLLATVETAKVTEFEDDIIEILISTVSNSGVLAPNLSKVIYLFPTLATKFNFKVAQLLLAYNVLIEKVPGVFEDQQVVRDMIEIGIKGMDVPDDQVRDLREVFMTEGVMILHLAIQHLHTKLTEDMWLKIFQCISSHLFAEESQIKNFCTARLYGVFLSALYVNRVLCITYLVKTSQLEPLMEMMVKHASFFITDYDRKLLSLGLTILFDMKLKEKTLDNFAVRCLEFAILVLHVQRIEQCKKADFFKNKSLKTKDEEQDINIYSNILENFKALSGTEGDEDSSDEFDCDEDETEEMEMMRSLMTKKGQAQISLKNFNSPLTNVDEFNFFIETVKELKNTLSEDQYANFIGGIDSLARRALQGLLICKKVFTTNSRQEKVEVARKIAKVKPRKPKEE